MTFTTMSYKRKRALLACDFCRHRKRRCNGEQPCTTCRDSDAECIYQDLPSDRLDFTAPLSDTVVDQLNRIEALLQDHSRRISNFEGSLPPRHSFSQVQDLCQTIASPSTPGSVPSQHQLFHQLAEPKLEQILFLIPEHHSTSTSWLLLLPRIRSLLGDYPVDYFYEVEAKHALPSGLDLMPSTNTEMPVPMQQVTETLVTSYFKNVHPNYPIFSQFEFHQWHDRLMNEAKMDSPEACICLMVYALGKLTLGTRDDHINDEYCDELGVIYFQPALQFTMSRFTWSFKPDIRVSQALILAASYFAFLGRPLHSWKVVHSSSTHIQALLSRRRRRGPVSHSEEDLRAIWSCFMIECDRAAELEFPRSGVEVAVEDLPLPAILAPEDSDTLYFAAEISIRRLLNRIHSSLYSERHNTLQDRQANSLAPGSNTSLRSLLSVSSELNRQLEEWYTSIPSAFRPSLGLEYLPNDRQKILRIRYYAARHIIHRPFLLYAASQFSADLRTAETSILPVVLEKCEICVASCRTYLHNAAEMLQKRSPYLWTFSQSSLGALLILSIAKSSPQLCHLVYDLESLQQLIISILSRWATAGSSFEAITKIIELIKSKESFEFST